MWMPDRRQLLTAASFGIGAFAVPGIGLAGIMRQSGFTHGVASGEPSQASVLLWTRYRPASGDERTVRAEIAATPDFAQIIAGGEAPARPDADFTVRMTAGGLEPGRWYFYRFIAPDGSMSAIGRTRTLPEGPTARFAMGVFSCSNLPFGWFNAYAHAAARQDIDLMIHTGDYLYEYQRGTYPGADVAMKERVIEPAGEIIALTDYRLRHASYRADPDLQRLHQLFPMIAGWDDHEITNDAWKDGAQNHQPGEGDYAVRKAIAAQVYREWMPVSDAPWRQYQIGDLATLYNLETRITARDRQPSLEPVFAGGGDIAQALTRFRDEIWMDPARTMLGAEQEAWLAAGMAASVRAGTRWQVLAQQTNVGKVATPANAASLLAPAAPDFVKARVAAGVAAGRLGIPGNLDNWGGYPAARARLLQAAQAAEAELIVLAGDSHNAWAFDLKQDGKPAGVEFGGHSVTSPGYESYLTGAAPADVARALVEASEELVWADTSRRGYMVVTLTPDRAASEWVFMDTIRDKSLATGASQTISTARGTRTLQV